MALKRGSSLICDVMWLCAWPQSSNLNILKMNSSWSFETAESKNRKWHHSVPRNLICSKPNIVLTSGDLRWPHAAAYLEVNCSKARCRPDGQSNVSVLAGLTLQILKAPPVSALSQWRTEDVSCITVATESAASLWSASSCLMVSSISGCRWWTDHLQPHQSWDISSFEVSAWLKGHGRTDYHTWTHLQGGLHVTVWTPGNVV